MSIQWYPGHMTAAKKKAEEAAKAATESKAAEAAADSAE